jgi:hypothetical protein
MDINWETVIIAAIAAFPATVASVAALVQSKATHTAVDGRMDELLRIATKGAADDATLVEKRAEHLRKGEAALQAGRPKES